MMQSLRLRLVIGAMVAVVLILLLVGFGLSRIFSDYVAERYRTDMSAVIDQLAAGLELKNAKAVLVRKPADPRFDLPGSGLYWQIVSERGEVFRSRSLWDLEIPVAALVPGDYGFSATEGPDGAELLVHSRRILVEEPDGSRNFTLLAAFDRSVMDDALLDYHSAIAFMLALTAAVLVAAAFLQIGIGLAPLASLQSDVALVRSGLSRAVKEGGPRELRPLVGELNHLLRERETAIERARARASDLAHGLKTPLTVLLQLADNLAGAQRDLARQQIDLIRQRADRQLQSARLGVEQMAVTELAALVGKLVSVLKPVTEHRGIDWRIEVDEALTVDMDPADLAEALGNVLDNATRFAATVIQVTGRIEDEHLLIDVEDDGEGVVEEALSGIAGRGVHLDDKDPGSGLGLAISQDVLEAYGGSMRFSRSSMGGLKVSLGVPHNGG